MEEHHKNTQLEAELRPVFSFMAQSSPAEVKNYMENYGVATYLQGVSFDPEFLDVCEGLVKEQGDHINQNHLDFLEYSKTLTKLTAKFAQNGSYRENSESVLHVASAALPFAVFMEVLDYAKNNPDAVVAQEMDLDYLWKHCHDTVQRTEDTYSCVEGMIDQAIPDLHIKESSLMSDIGAEAAFVIAVIGISSYVMGKKYDRIRESIAKDTARLKFPLEEDAVIFKGPRP